MTWRKFIIYKIVSEILISIAIVDDMLRSTSAGIEMAHDMSLMLIYVYTSHVPEVDCRMIVMKIQFSYVILVQNICGNCWRLLSQLRHNRINFWSFYYPWVPCEKWYTVMLVILGFASRANKCKDFTFPCNFTYEQAHPVAVNSYLRIILHSCPYWTLFTATWTRSSITSIDHYARGICCCHFTIHRVNLNFDVSFFFFCFFA